MEAFSHSVSHDLRAPLRAIDGFSTMLLSSQKGRLGAEGERLLDVIRANTKRMAQLIDDLLSFSRAGRHEITLARVDLEGVVKGVWAELLAQDPSPPAELRLQPLPTAQGDPALLRQVFLNLLSNALKFSSRRERRIVEVGFAGAGSEAAYFVRDNGAGFDQRYAGKLFGVFERLHGQAEFPGTGVGLSIVKRIVERHHGRVWAKGEPGAGATIHFTLAEIDRT
jgi:two-component system sensor kinase